MIPESTAKRFVRRHEPQSSPSAHSDQPDEGFRAVVVMTIETASGNSLLFVVKSTHFREGYPPGLESLAFSRVGHKD